MIKKTFTTILSIFMMITFLTGCASSVSTSQLDNSDNSYNNIELVETSNLEGVEITFWHSMGGVNGQALDTLVEKFNNENEFGITVISEYQGEYDDSLTKLKSAKLGNMEADLVQIYDIGTKFMLESGWIVPIEEISKLDNYDLSNIDPNISAYYTIDGTLYSMPFNSSTPIMYYNKDMFEQAGITEIPTSLEEIILIGEDLLNKSDAQEVISLSIYSWFFEQFICKQGLDYTDNNNGRNGYATKVVFDENGAGENVLTLWKELYDLGYAPNVGKGGSAGLTDFSSGKSAITIASTATLAQILQDVDGKFEVGTAYFPSVYSSDKGGVSIGGASLWALNDNDPAKLTATWEFIKFLISSESQAYWSTQTGYFPVTITAQEEEVFKTALEKYPQLQTALDQLHDSSPEYAGALLSVFSEVRATVESEIENMLNNNIEPSVALQTITESVNSAIEEYNLLNY
ncbi:MAG: ABC transporter substrate-binding protein [Eubacteriales bacterium]|nr:ABC transporter substrate-binding protein [Eubacteriales bacterium]